MPFPLGEWIDRHPGCRHDLAQSGMRGSIPPPMPSAAELRAADEEELRGHLANDLKVDRGRVFLTTGASAANALVVLFLARGHRRVAAPTCRVAYPEYPPLFDIAREAGFRLTSDDGPVELAVISQPRNPEGDLWERSRFREWSARSRHLLVDETFREFAGSRSLVEEDHPGLWATGSFTKFYAGDHLRLGFLVAPEEAESEFAKFHGLVANELSPFAVAGATRALRDRERVRRQVRSILAPNVAALRTGLPHVVPPRSPIAFDRLPRGDTGDGLARRALRASVLVCSGSFFGDPAGVRLCLTRPSFPTDLAAYLAVRSRRSRSVRPRREARRTRRRR